jgi:ribosomal protein S18 acetylase RimI-like enzyme
MQFVDRALAMRLEAAEDLAQLRYAEAAARTYPEAGIASEEVAGGHMVFDRVGSPIGRAIALGLRGPITSADIDRIEQFYFSRGADAQLEVTPLADESLFQLVRHRAYRLAELNNVLARGLAGGEKFSATAAGFEIRRAEPEEAERCVGITAEAFGKDFPPEMAQFVAPMFSSSDLLFVAESGGELAAVGAGLISPEHKMVAFFGAATRIKFRGRGLQTALIGARLNAAVEAGCTLAVTVTRGGTTSQRNAERLGFTVQYTKAVMVRERQPAIGSR